MSNSEILLDVSAADESSEVMVVDSAFHVLARGIHAVQLKVPPGIYRAKVRVGDQQSEKLFSVESNEPNNHKTVQLEPLEFSSPIPLQKTSTSREFHQSAIYHAAGAGGETAQLGLGAGLVIFLRDPSLVYFNLAADQIEAYRKNFEGFVLSKLDGSDPRPIESLGTLAADHGYLIASVAVTPGTYTLSRASSGNERLCLPLVVPAGWSLQIFVTMVPTDNSAVDSALSRRADFDGAAMVFDRPGAGFSPDRADLRVLEVTRQALARGHNVVDANTMDALLFGKYENPMMGLLAAHLLLLSKNADLQLAQKVVTNTGNLIGADYPDLLVLSWKLGQLLSAADAPDAKTLVEKMKGPPLLQLSWHYFMEAYRTLFDKDILDAGLTKMAGQLVSSSVWVSWLENIDYQSAPAEAIGSVGSIAATASSAPKMGNEFRPARHAPSAPAPSASPKSMGSLSFGKGDLANVVLRSARFVTGKVTDWLDATTGLRNLKLPTLATPKEALPDVDTTHTDLRQKLQNVGADAAAHIFATLVERVDWKSVVGQLKSATLFGAKPRPLTPLQRQLLLSLKAAREQFEDEGKLPEDAAGRRMKISDVPVHAILNDLNLLFTIASNLDKARPAGTAKTVAQDDD